MVRKAKTIQKNKYDSVKSILEFLYNLSIDRHENYCFRGQNNFLWKLEPSIFRNLERYQTVIYEDLLLAIKPENLDEIYTKFDIEWLMLCQHNGIPTRLLDWSTDILTALFFACYDEKGENSNKDAALFITNQNNYKRFSMYNLSLTKSQELSFINTYLTNPRLRAQNGCFMLWGHENINSYNLESYIITNQHNNNNNNNIFLEKLRIPAGSKNKILEELKEKYFISKETIYLYELSKEKDKINWAAIKKAVHNLSLYITNPEKINTDEKNLIYTTLNIRLDGMFQGCTALKTSSLSSFIRNLSKDNLKTYIENIGK